MMTDQEINIAIAEACGWKREDVINPLGGASVELWTCGTQRVVTSEALPEYCNDLNAMHRAEVHLENEMAICDQYWKQLAEQTMADDDELATVTRYRYIGNATAHQRAEAFLRAIGKWT